jgi:hypothetical protein
MKPLRYLPALLAVLMASCDKGYQVRFSNYYTEPMDSVVIGENKIIFTGIETATSTDLKKISKGKYNISCVSKSKARFYSSIFISRYGSGTRTIQVDGIGQVSILEE